MQDYAGSKYIDITVLGFFIIPVYRKKLFVRLYKHIYFNILLSSDKDQITMHEILNIMNKTQNRLLYINN